MLDKSFLWKHCEELKHFLHQVFAEKPEILMCLMMNLFIDLHTDVHIQI